jgi:LPXTG-motif cell wall-anchored protein
MADDLFSEFDDIGSADVAINEVAAGTSVVSDAEGSGNFLSSASTFLTSAGSFLTPVLNTAKSLMSAKGGAPATATAKTTVGTARIAGMNISTTTMIVGGFVVAAIVILVLKRKKKK